MSQDKTDTQLKQALAKMLPEKVEIINHGCEREPHICYYWKPYQHWDSTSIKDTELLHLCWLVEKTLTTEEISEVLNFQMEESYKLDPENKAWGRHCMCATWQQRTIALCKVKGIEIV